MNAEKGNREEKENANIAELEGLNCILFSENMRFDSLEWMQKSSFCNELLFKMKNRKHTKGWDLHKDVNMSLYVNELQLLCI